MSALLLTWDDLGVSGLDELSREDLLALSSAQTQAIKALTARLDAWVVYLPVFQHIPVARVVELVTDLTGARSSAGWVCRVLRETAIASRPVPWPGRDRRPECPAGLHCDGRNARRSAVAAAGDRGVVRVEHRRAGCP